jgi:RNase P protein component
MNESTETSVIDDLIDALHSLSPFKTRHMAYCARRAEEEYECSCGLSQARHKVGKAIDRARKYQREQQKEAE